MKKYRWASLLLVFVSIQAQSAVISADVTGFDSADVDFWGVSFDSGSGFIESIEFDLSPLSALDIRFDFNGATIPQLTSPVIGSTSGLSAQDINADFNGISPTSLSFTFNSNTFGAGDTFRFTADTDSTVLLSNPFGELHHGLLFTVLFEDGTLISDNFIVLEQFVIDGSSKSGLTLTTPVPIPPALWLFGSGLIAISLRRNKTQTEGTCME